MTSTEAHPSAPPVLIFRSKSGRTEVARQPDGTLYVHVLTGKDALGASEIGELRRALPPVFEPGTTDAVTPNRRGTAEVDRAVYRLLSETGHETSGAYANDGALTDAVDRALSAYRELRGELIGAAAERDALAGEADQLGDLRASLSAAEAEVDRLRHALVFNAITRALPLDRFVSLSERMACADAVLAALDDAAPSHS